MKVNKGKVELLKHVPNMVLLAVEDWNHFKTCARLTPSEAIRIADQLKNWAFRTIKRKLNEQR